MKKLSRAEVESLPVMCRALLIGALKYHTESRDDLPMQFVNDTINALAEAGVVETNNGRSADRESIDETMLALTHFNPFDFDIEDRVTKVTLTAKEQNEIARHNFALLREVYGA